MSLNRKAPTALLCFLVLAPGTVLGATRSGPDLQVIEVGTTPLQHALELEGPAGLVDLDGQYLLLDVSHHRLLRLDSELKVRLEIGGIGQERARFFYPVGLGVDRQRNIYVLDSRNNRVQVFDWDGNFRNQFPVLPRPVGFAVSPSGEVYVGQPATGKLVSVYGPAGEPRGGFGELKRLSDFYGKQFEERDKQYKLAINRCLLAVHSDGGVLVAFVGSPYLQKYDADRKLVFEKRLEGKHAEGIFEAYAKDGKAMARTGYDSVPTPLVVTGLASNPVTGDIYVALLWKQSWLHVSDASGSGKAILEFAVGSDFVPGSLSVSEDGRQLFAPKLDLKRHDMIYRIRLPPIP